jgi:endonuclease-8
MPEGDTIFRAARTLHRALAGKPVVRFESMLPALTRVHVDTPLTSQTIDSVSASGKHLLMRFSGGLVLRTHMRMNGSWHIYRPDETWQRPRRDMRIMVATADFVAVGFNIQVAEFFPARDLARHQELRQLGPDLLSEQFDEDEAVRRIRARAGEPIAEVLLNQRVVAGIGNVYKSETLFLCRQDPFAPVGAISHRSLDLVLDTARSLMAATLRRGVRATRPSLTRERTWVYGRRGRPCRRCGTEIRMRRQGTDMRSTYWCPSCQPG